MIYTVIGVYADTIEPHTRLAPRHRAQRYAEGFEAANVQEAERAAYAAMRDDARLIIAGVVEGAVAMADLNYQEDSHGA